MVGYYGVGLGFRVCPKAQNSPKALHSMVFGPKSLQISVLRAYGLGRLI